jgi:hypothetical protein
MVLPQDVFSVFHCCQVMSTLNISADCGEMVGQRGVGVKHAVTVHLHPGNNSFRGYEQATTTDLYKVQYLL